MDVDTYLKAWSAVNAQVSPDYTPEQSAAHFISDFMALVDKSAMDAYFRSANTSQSFRKE